MSNRTFIPLSAIAASDDNDDDLSLHSPSTIVHLPSSSSLVDDDDTLHKHDESEKQLLATDLVSSTKRQQEDQRNMGRMQRVIVICFFFFLVELVGGLWSGSLALVSDSFHLLSDAAGFGISLMAIKVAQKPATKRYSFGYHRAEVVGVLISVMLLYALTAVLLNEAWQRLERPEPVDGKTMFVIAAIGLGVNLTYAVPGWTEVV
jgi:Co/Zn/Cd efflux system component